MDLLAAYFPKHRAGQKHERLASLSFKLSRGLVRDRISRDGAVEVVDSRYDHVTPYMWLLSSTNVEAFSSIINSGLQFYSFFWLIDHN
eukprot:scaffold834_cov123-Cylindrotheca_fusiformis.AAC.11